MSSLRRNFRIFELPLCGTRGESRIGKTTNYGPIEIRLKLSTGSINRNTYLVDPASGHMLVSKIKPCMSMHKPINGEAANGSLQQPLFT